MAGQKVKIIWDDTIQAYRLTSPFIKELREFLSQRVPHSDRHWDDQHNNWVYVERQHDNVMQVLKLIGASVTCVTRQQCEAQAQASQQAAARSGKAPIDTVVMQFIRLTPLSALKKAYLGAAMEIHPDRSLDPDAKTKMATLNEAWERIQKEIYGQS